MIASVLETYAALTGTRNGRRIGQELFVRCVRPENHKNGDAQPSLRINERKDVWTCDVCGQAGGRSLDLVKHSGYAPDRTEALTWMRERGLADDAGGERRVQRFYYDGAEGQDLTDGAVDRIEPGLHGEPKSFVQYRKLTNGEYKAGLGGKKLPLYRRREVLAACAAGETVFLVEGELKCDQLISALTEAGSPAAATTIAGGAQANLNQKMAQDLAGAHKVVILPDADAPGRTAGVAKANAILKAHARMDVRILDLFPEHNDGADIHDWLVQGGTAPDLLSLSQSAPQFSIGGTADTQTPATVKFIRASDLLAESDGDDLEFVIDRIIAAGGTAILAGRPKGGKSTLALNLALRVARGESFLGRHSKKGPVLYLALEGARGGWKATLRKLAVTDADDLYICIERAPTGALVWLRSAIEEHKPALVIVDTAQRLLRVREGNDYSETSNAFDAVIELARQSGAALLLLHHSGKTRHDEIVDEVMGSTAWAAAVDTVLVLRKSEHYRTLASDQRFGENLADTVLTFDSETLRVDTTGETKDCAEIRIARDSIIELLHRWERERPDDSPDTGAIVEAVKGRKEIVLGALRESAEAGILERSGSGKKGDPFKYKCKFGSAVPHTPQEPKDKTRAKGAIPEEIENNSVPTQSLSSNGAGTAQESQHGPTPNPLGDYEYSDP